MRFNNINEASVIRTTYKIAFMDIPHDITDSKFNQMKSKVSSRICHAIQRIKCMVINQMTYFF